MTDRQNSRRFLLLFLGVLSAFGPFIMDMYLPTLPAMADFSTLHLLWYNWDSPPA